jgi:ubiquinone/menaquinone biosynthesis C-methylase UbiE
LHFAPEEVFYKKFKRMPNLNYIAADSLISFIDGLCNRPDVAMDICDIRFPDESFDVVICNHVLEHVRNDGKAMREIYRVLRYGGWAILQVPIRKDQEKTLEDPNIVTDADRFRFYGSPDHVRFYGKDYKNKLESVGFKVNIDSYVQSIPPYLVQRYRLDKNEDIYIVYK